MQRKKLLRTVFVASLLVGGLMNPRIAEADTSMLSSSEGWEKVTSLSDVTDYFYVIVDNANDLMVGLDGTQIKYQTSASPVSNLSKVWALEASGSSYGLRNLSNTKLLLQTEWGAGWNINLNDQPNVCEWTNLNFAYASGVWTIENGKYTYVDESSSDSSPFHGYLGPWNGNGTQADGQRIAGNKNKANYGTFQIYRIARSRFLSLYIAANTTPVDVSFYVAGLTNSTSAWTKNYTNFNKNYQAQRGSNKNTDAYSNWGYLESWNDGTTFTGTLTTTLNNLPDGLYDIGAYCFKETGDVVSFTVGSQSTALASTDNNYQYVSVNKEEVAWEGTNANSKTIGLGITGATWTGITDVRLTYYGPVTLADVAVALPASGDMTADSWYYLDIALAGSDYNATATTLADIVFTTDGTAYKKNSSAITSQFSATGNTLSATRYYVKSSSANNLVVEAASYTYTVGTATSSHAYVQGGETVTITWADAITNNGNASFAKNGSPSITFNSSAISVTETTNGFTFTVPSSLTANTSYTLAIPANAFGYAAGSTYNEAQNITFNTPALFDQTAFLKDNGSGLYLARGLAWGTRAYLDEYGIATRVATDADGYTSIIFVDTDRKLYYDGSNNLWCDSGGSGDDTKWVVTLNDGKYRLTGKTKTSGTDFVKYDQSDASRNLWANITGGSGENIVDWTLVNASDYASAMTALKNTQASTAATAAGTSAATPDALATAVSEWNKTKVITGTTPTAAPEKFKQGQTNPAPITIVSDEVTITTPGLYKFSMQAFYRMRGNAENYTLHTEGYDLPAAYVFFGNAKTQIASVFDHAESSAYSSQDYANSNNHYPDGTASALTAFQAGNYTNTVWTYISQSDIDAATDGKFAYGIKYEGWPNYISGWNNGNAQLGVAQWSCWTVESIDLTLYSQDLWPSLQAALTTYAPYNDVTDATDYTTHYNTYAAYTESTSQSDMQTAITYMQENYADYQWANACIAHPVDVTDGIISGWECTSNEAWPGSGRTTATGTYYDGTSRTYFTQNHENGAARTQEVKIPENGAYLLRTIVRPVAAASFATISVGDESTTTRGVQTGSANIGNNWAYNDVYFATTAANTSKTIGIALSNVNNSREADCGEMHLLYIGQSADFVKDGVHKYIGTFATAPALEVTDEVPVVDVKAATFTSGTSAVTFTNPNGLVFVASDGQTSAAKNEVVGTTCASLQLEKGHPFVNPTEFTATSAKYTLASGELAGGSFATLMIPFAASSLAGTAYTLDQGVDLIDGNIRGTTASSIAANSPVLVTTAGVYSGSNVSVPVVAAGATYTVGELVGTYTAIKAPANSYVLQNHTSGEGVAFYLVGSTQPTVNPFRAYIKAQANNVKAFKVVLGDENGIESLTTSSVDGMSIYNVAGQRLSKPVKGINIVNGKKVIIK